MAAKEGGWRNVMKSRSKDSHRRAKKKLGIRNLDSQKGCAWAAKEGRNKFSQGREEEGEGRNKVGPSQAKTRPFRRKRSG